MFQNTRTRLVAPGLASPTGLEALVLEPWADAAREADRLLAAVARADGRAADGRTPEGRADAQENAWVPAVDVVEREDAIRLAVEVPGVDPAAIDVTVNDRVLTVSGERRLARPEGASAYRLERRFGRFARSLTLPRTVDAERIAARYEHGVLHLELPKRAEAQPRRIAVATGGAAPAAGERREIAAEGAAS
jgi:HSP20 family protein